MQDEGAYKDDKSPQKRSIYKAVTEERDRSFMLDSVLNQIPGGVGIFTFGEQLSCQYYSDGLAKMAGYTREEIDEKMEKGTLLKDLIAPSEYKKLFVVFKNNILNGEPLNLTYRYLYKDGSIRWLQMSGTKMGEEDGKPVYYCIFSNPSEESMLYRSIVEDSTNGVFVAERETRRVLYMNKTISKLFGIPQELFRRRVNHSETISKEFVFLTQEDVRSLKENEFREFHIIWKEQLYLEIKAKALKWNGIDAYIMYFKDETMDVNRHAELQKLIDEVPTGIGIYEIRNGQLFLAYLNDAYYAMLGVNRESRRQFFGNNVMDAANPEDYEILNAGIQKMIQGEDYVEILHRVKDQTGAWFWLNLKASVVERKKDYIKIYASFSDYNKIVHAKQEMERNRNLMNEALNSAKVLAWRYDYRCQRITDSATLGETYHLPKVIENVPQSLVDAGFIHEKSIPDFMDLFERVPKENKPSTDILAILDDEKHMKWYHLTYTSLFDGQGNYVESVGSAIDITEQKEREQNYEEELQLKKIAAQHSLATANYNLTKNRITHYESPYPELAKILEQPTVDDVLREIRTNVLNIEETEKFAKISDCETMLKLFENGTTHVEVRHHLKEDSRWMQSSFHMLKNPYTGDIEAISILRDISDAVRAELIINRLLQLDYQTIVTIDTLTGAVRPFRNGTVEKVILDSNLEEIEEKLEHAPFFESMYTLNKDGKMLWQRVIYAYLETNKSVLLCAVQDVTDTYEQEEKQKEALKNALYTAEKANHAKTEFLSRMSHDMRTPMNGILGLAELSLQETDEEVLKQNILQMKESGEYLLHLINDTLDFQRIESGKLTLNEDIVYAKTLYQTVIDIMHPMMKEKEIDFHVNVHNANMDCYVQTDTVRVKQIFLNLLSNALKFTQSGKSVTMDIQVTEREKNVSHCQVCVIDEGIGMSREFVENHLFRPFEQEQNGVSALYAGSGLGMSIVHSLVEMMGGHMEVESEQEKGTTVSVFLDFRLVEGKTAEKRIQKEKRTQCSLEEQIFGRHILLVEDHPLNAQITKKLLEKVGCSIHWENNGAEGVNAFLASAPGEYDVILMDVRMPVMNGLEAAKAIRASKHVDAKRIPIIAMTANAYAEDVKQSMDAGMNAHLAKPVETRKLYETIANQMLSD